MLKKPYLASTDNRKKLARINEFSGDPFTWFDNKFVISKGIGITTFDFF